MGEVKNSFLVRNEAGEEWAVDEDKLSDAEKDGYLPVVSNGQETHRVASSDLPLAKQDGYSPINEADFWEQVDAKADKDEHDNAISTKAGDLIKSVGEGVPGAGFVQKGASALEAGVNYALNTEGSEGKSFGELYDEGQARRRQESIERHERSPVIATVGNVAGALAVPNPAGIAGRVGLNVADAATRADSVDEAIDNAETAGLVSGAFEALPYLKRLIPGTEGAYKGVNKAVAKVASVLPTGNSATADEIYEVLSKPTARRVAKEADMLKLTDEVIPHLEDATSRLDDAVGTGYSRLQDEAAMAAGDIPDLMNTIRSDVRAARNYIDSNKVLFSNPASKVVDGVAHILNESSDGLDAYKLLKARRHLDDLMKNKNWEALNAHDREVIESLRGRLNLALHESIPGADAMRQADDLFSGYRKTVGEFFDRVGKRGKDGVALDKLHNDLRSGSARGATFDKELVNASRWVEEHADKLGDEAGAAGVSAFTSLAGLRKVGDMSRQLDYLKKASGGLSSQAINALAQAFAGIKTMGASLIGLPVTNPSLYMQILDSLPHETIAVLQHAASKGQNQLALTHYLLMKNDAEYRRAFEDAD
jgi:hypothetical protein